jgi:aryl-alcohol dehydrogenase-like predicted oxidoreductase
MVTCPLPATDKLKHLEDNMAALRGRVPDRKLCERIARDLS